MTTTIFATHHYNYPQNFIEMKPKLTRLEQAIKKLEANLLDADTEVLEKRLASHLGLQVDYASELNANQLLAATTIEGKVLVIAGAGSGKTKTLTYRTSYLIENGVSPKEILLLTFTRKAANEIKSRAKKLRASTPSFTQRLDKDLEERKLFYVACSRAKARLFLTAPDYFSSYSGYFDKVSRFITEVAADKITVVTGKESLEESDDPVWW